MCRAEPNAGRILVAMLRNQFVDFCAVHIDGGVEKPRDGHKDQDHSAYLLCAHGGDKTMYGTLLRSIRWSVICYMLDRQER